MDSALDLDGFFIVDRQETEHDIRFTIKVGTSTLLCPYCKSMERPHKHGVVTQLYMDMPIRGKRVGLAIRVQRYKCQDCGKTNFQPLPHLHSKRAATQRLIRYIEAESLKRTFTSIANDVGVTEATVRAVFRDHVRHLERTVSFETPEWLGLDELKLMKKVRGIVTNVKERTVIEMLAKRDMPIIGRYLSNLPNKERVQIVTMDMWNPYRQSVQAVLPKAQIVVDKFHVVRMATVALDSVRKDIRRSLTDRERRTLMHDRFILLRRRGDLKQGDILKRDVWLSKFPRLAAAYALKEAFYDLWEAPTKQEAQEEYNAWLASMPDDLAPFFYDLTTAMTNWREEIFAHFEYGRITNAYTEAVNGLAKLIARNGRGYSFEAVRAKVLYGNGLKMSKRPKYDRRKNFDDIRMAFSIEEAINPPVVEPDHYDSLGNEISTLSQYWQEGT